MEFPDRVFRRLPQVWISPKILVDMIAEPDHTPKHLVGIVAMKIKKESEHLTRLEMEIMNVLWEDSPASVQTVQRQFGRNLA